MKTDKIRAALRQIRDLIDEALSDADKKGSSRRKVPTVRKTVEASSGAKALPMYILKLRDAGFFHPPKTAPETHAKLQPIYACDLNRVSMALKRLKDRKELRKTSKMVGDRKLIAYVW